MICSSRSFNGVVAPNFSLRLFVNLVLWLQPPLRVCLHRGKS